MSKERVKGSENQQNKNIRKHVETPVAWGFGFWEPHVVWCEEYILYGHKLPEPLSSRPVSLYKVHDCRWSVAGRCNFEI